MKVYVYTETEPFKDQLSATHQTLTNTTVEGEIYTLEKLGSFLSNHATNAERK